METKVKLLKYAHTVGESNLHLQLTPKYRKPIFRDRDVLIECEHAFQEIASDLKIQLSCLGFGPDHVHLFVSGWKNYSIAVLAQRFKGRTSKIIRKKYPVRLTVQGLYGNQLWSDGYFHRTVGAVTTEAMKNMSQNPRKNIGPQKNQFNNRRRYWNSIKVTWPRGLQPTELQKIFKN